MKKPTKTHKYKIIKTYTPEEIIALGNVESFTDEVTDRVIKLRRAQILNKIGYQCVEPGCELTKFHFGLGVDNGGGIHLDLYGYDKEDELVMVTIDHIKPKSKGGKDHESNFQPLCKIHNEIKSNAFNMNRQFKDLNLIYSNSDLYTQNYIILKKNLTQEELDLITKENKPITMQFIDDFVVGEEYVILYKRDEGVMMSTHPLETRTNQGFINAAYGDVIIFGLGLGMIVFPLLMDDSIKSITIVEMDTGLIDVVGGVIAEHDYMKKVKIVEGDAFTYCNKLDKERFDTIYFDIWININVEAFAEMERLHELYKKFRRGDVSYMHSWCYEFKDKYIN